MSAYVDPVGILIFILALIATGVILLVAKRKKTEKLQRVQTFAAANGWIFTKIEDRLDSGFRIQKGSWTLESLRTSNGSSDSSTSSSISSSTVWWTKAAVIPQGCILIGPRQVDVPKLGGIGDIVRQAALQIMIGGDAEHTQGIHEMEISRATLRERYMVWTNQEDIAQRMLDMEVENALLKMPKDVFIIVKVTPLNLEIKLRDQCLEKPEYIAAMVRLGETLIDALG